MASEGTSSGYDLGVFGHYLEAGKLQLRGAISEVFLIRLPSPGPAVHSQVCIPSPSCVWGQCVCSYGPGIPHLKPVSDGTASCWAAAQDPVMAHHSHFPMEGFGLSTIDPALAWGQRDSLKTS